MKMVNHPNRRTTKAAMTAAAAVVETHNYDNLTLAVRRSFQSACTAGAAFFRTNIRALNEIYLNHLPADRQSHNCHACRHFIERYGDLVWVDDTGKTHSVMWDPEFADAFYKPSFKRLKIAVEQRSIESPFISSEKVWGQPVTGPWTHMAVMPPELMIYEEGVLNASQREAQLCENFVNVSRALGEFQPALLDELLRVLESDALARSDRFIAPFRWLRALHDRPRGNRGDNLLWRAVAAAPEGYCHPRSSVVAPLLDDIKAGVPFDEMKRRFDKMMHPLQYQRPQAPPAAGNIAAAEKLVEQLGIERSLQRRFARLDEVPLIWMPEDVARRGAAPAATGGVFGDITPKRRPASRYVPAVDLPPVTVTWAKFSTTVVPTAEQIELDVPSAGPFIALTTAVHADAPPILKWDRPEERNPLAWYVYPNGSSASDWGLMPGWTKVNGIALLPPMMGTGPAPFLGNGIVMILDGALDRKNGGLALFPECLRAELHGVRATIEAYSKTHWLCDRQSGSACGYDFRSNGSCRGIVRVMAAGKWQTYHIDRWD